MNHSAKNARNDKPADAGSDSDIHELGAETELSDLEIEELVADEITGVREKVARTSTPPPVPTKVQTEHRKIVEQMTREEKEEESYEAFVRKVTKGFKRNPKTGVWEKITPSVPKSKIRDEGDLQGT